MIPRYTRPEMGEIWSEANKYAIWLEIETLAAEKMAELRTIPATVPQALRERASFDVARIHEIEAGVKHDVIAFLSNVAEYVGDEARYLHQGMTSSDVLDTSLAVHLAQSADLMLEKVARCMAALEKRAQEHKYTLCMGRSHGIHAEPTTFGLKLAGHYAAFARAHDRLKAARAEIATCAISGAVGTYASIDQRVEAHVAEQLGLTPEPVSTQVIPRDRHAIFTSVLGVIAGSMENLAVEIRHLQRTEVREAQEYFSDKQKGSSAMPHKRNPILSENLTGLARIVRAGVTPALENVALWHERDISHSSVERVTLPDACIALDFALYRLAGMIENLVVYPENMKANMQALNGLVYSQAVLLALTQAGISREDAYQYVQRCAARVWDSGGTLHFMEALKSDGDVTAHLDERTLDNVFDTAPYTQHVDTIFERVFTKAT